MDGSVWKEYILIFEYVDSLQIADSLSFHVLRSSGEDFSVVGFIRFERVVVPFFLEKYSFMYTYMYACTLCQLSMVRRERNMFLYSLL